MGITEKMVIKANAAEIDIDTSSNIATVYGDANCDNIVDITDVVLLKAWLLNSKKYSVSEQGLINADVQGNGNGINSNDVVAVQQYALKLIDKLPIDEAEKFIIPKEEYLIDPNDNPIDHDTCQKLINAVAAFDLKRYKIVYSKEPVMYSIMVPTYWLADTYFEEAFQLAPSVPYFKEYFPKAYQISWVDIGSTDDEFYYFDMILWRPDWRPDWEEEVEQYDEVDENFVYICESCYFGQEPLILIPLDEEENEVLEFMHKKV